LSKHNLFTCLVKAYNKDIDNFAEFRINCDNYAVSTGTSGDDFRNLNTIVTGIGAQFICIDVANGYSEHFGDFVERVRNRWPDRTIIAGNVVTGDMTQELILRGADIVKVGIGPGSVCTTRVQTGVGYPQLSAIIECADAAHGLGGHIIADGGCTCPGDVAKAFGAGADFVMLGGMLAGHDEGGGKVIYKSYLTNELDNKTGEPYIDTQDFVEFYGMSSDTAMSKHHGGVAEYRSSEGRTVEIPYRISINETVLNILGGLRSTCTYVGAETLKQLPKCTTFIRVNRQINDVFLT
jgi:GMP reductase